MEDIHREQKKYIQKPNQIKSREIQNNNLCHTPSSSSLWREIQNSKLSPSKRIPYVAHKIQMSPCFREQTNDKCKDCFGDSFKKDLKDKAVYMYINIASFFLLLYLSQAFCV